MPIARSSSAAHLSDYPQESTNRDSPVRRRHRTVIPVSQAHADRRVSPTCHGRRLGPSAGADSSSNRVVVGRERTISRVLFPRRRGRWPSISDAGCPAPPATATRGLGEQPGDALLFGLAPGGVYLAGRSPGRRWALTPPFHPCRLAPAVSFLWHFPSGRPDWALPSALLSGARTFLPVPERERSGHPSASTQPILPRQRALPVASSIARLASASAPRLRSLGTWLTLTRGNCPSRAWTCRCSGCRPGSRTL